MPGKTAPRLKTTLALDAAFEFAVAALLLLFREPFGDWLSIGSMACVVIGVVFAIAGVALVALYRQPHPDRDVIRTLAFANIAGGLAGWALVLAMWPHIDVWGRTSLGAASDIVILIGIFELLALRRAETTALSDG